MPSVKKKRVPEFRSEDEARRFWAENDSSEFIDWASAARRKLPNLRPSLRTISLRLPVVDDRGFESAARTSGTFRTSLC